MGTNYYRIPKEEELAKSLREYGDFETAFDLFKAIVSGEVAIDVEDFKIHIGKNSGGWRFLWNWNDGEYYNSKEELLNFIRCGSIYNEYGDLQDAEEFIDFALNKEGWDDTEYIKQNPRHGARVMDKYIDGLRVSTSRYFS